MLSRCSETSCSHPVLETISLRILTASSLLMFSKLTSFTWLADNSKHNYLVKSNDTTPLHYVFMTKMLFRGSAEGLSCVFMHFSSLLCLTCLQMPANPKLLSMGNTVNNIKTDNMNVGATTTNCNQASCVLLEGVAAQRWKGRKEQEGKGEAELRLVSKSLVMEANASLRLLTGHETSNGNTVVSL